MTDPAARKHLVDALAFALAHRVPKGLLRDAGRARGDEVAVRAIAAALADHVELSNIRYHLGPPGPAPTTSFGGRPRE